MIQPRHRLLHIGIRSAVALLPAVALGVYVRHPGMAWLSFVALVPWIVLYTDARHPRISSAYYAVGALTTWIALYPGSYGYGWFAPLFLGLICVVWWLPFAPVLRRLHHRFALPRAWTAPLIWVAVEWLRAEFTVGNFDLYRLGYSQARFVNMIQISDLTGVYGISFLVVAVNGMFADVAFALRDGGTSSSTAPRQRRVLLSVASVIAMILVTYAYGTWRASGLVVEDGPRIAVVQPNVRHTIRNIRGVHLMQLLMTLDEVPRGGADLIVWPENAIMNSIEGGGSYLEDLAWLAAQKDASLLVGALGVLEEHPGRTTNSAFLITKQGQIVGNYAKTVLFAWTEYIPQDRLLERVSPRLHRMHRAMARISWGFLPTGLPGEGAVRLDLETDEGVFPFGSLICVENAYPPLPADNRMKGARFLINLTSEGDVGGPVQEQLLRISIFRSVENRVGYVRAANTGISGFIDPVGRVQSLVVGENGGTIAVSGVKIHPVGVVAEGPTVYARSGDAFAKGCVVASLVLWGLTWWRRKRGAAAVLATIVLGSGGCAGVPQIGSDVEGARDALEEGLRLRDEGRHREALNALVAACADPSPCREALRPTAACFIKTLQPENGADYFAGVEQRYPRLAAEASRYRGYMLEKSLMPRRAEEAYGESLEHMPTAETFELLGIQRVRNGDRQGGIAVFREGIRTVPRTTRLRALLGRALLEAGQPEEARIQLDAALGDDPRNASAWITLGRIYAALDETASATAALKRAIALDDSSIEGRFQLARLALRAGDEQEARRLLGKISTIEQTLGRGPREDD